MARQIQLTDGGLRVSYSGLSRIATLVDELELPCDEIESADVGLPDAPRVMTLRRVGLANPVTGRRMGRFWTEDRSYFLDLARPERALVVRLRPESRFDVVAIETEGAERLADEIRARCSST